MHKSLYVYVTFYEEEKNIVILKFRYKNESLKPRTLIIEQLEGDYIMLTNIGLLMVCLAMLILLCIFKRN